MPETSDLLEKSALFFLYNFHREHSWLKSIIKKVIAENQCEKHKKSSLDKYLRGVVIHENINGIKRHRHEDANSHDRNESYCVSGVEVTPVFLLFNNFNPSQYDRRLACECKCRKRIILFLGAALILN